MRAELDFVSYLVALLLGTGACTLDATGTSQARFEPEADDVRPRGPSSRGQAAMGVDDASAFAPSPPEERPEPDVERDAGEPPVSTADAEALDDATRDAASSAPQLTLDGVASADEWDRAACARQTVASNWDGAKNAISELRAQLHDGALWLLVAGAVESPNAIVVYVDAQDDVGTIPSTLTDQMGELDDAIASVVSTPAERAPELAWATTSVADDATLGGRSGVRDLRTPNDMKWVARPVAQTACRAGVCEARIALDVWGDVDDIAIFARLTNASGTLLSNQTLPVEDDVTFPAWVDHMLDVPQR